MKILFVHNTKVVSPFVIKDLAILRKHYEVEDFPYTPRKTLQLFKAIKNCDLVYVWFISYPAYLIGMINKLCRYKKHIVLVAGGYGVQEETLKKHPIFKLMVKSAIKNATNIFAVSKYTGKAAIDLGARLGKLQLVYNGIDLKKFRDLGTRANKRPHVLTVGYINSWKRFYLKGIDKFIDYAKETPNSDFTVIGVSFAMRRKLFKMDMPKNIHFYSTRGSLRMEYAYNEADVYCQFSKYESFSMTLLEALACGCMVYFTPGNGMDEVFANRKDLSVFSIEHREKRLVGLLNAFKC